MWLPRPLHTGAAHSIRSRYADEGPGRRDRGPPPHALEPRKGAVSVDRVSQGRRHRVLPSHRTVAASAPCRTTSDAGARAGRPGRPTLLREELSIAPSGVD